MYAAKDIQRVQDLEQRMYGSIGRYGPLKLNFESVTSRHEMLHVLYVIAALVYLNRMVWKISEINFGHQRLLREGFLILKRLEFCESAWPLFILACEADDDKRRLEVLQVFSKTLEQKAQRSNHIPTIQALVAAVWNQNDLNLDNGVDYMTTLNAVISTAPFLPLLA